MVHLYRDYVFCLHSILQKVIYNWGTQFISSFMKDLYHLLKITGNPSIAYHPQTDRQIERTNQEVEQYLHIYTNYKQSDWAE